MKITIIHGQSHKGSTYNLSHLLAEKFNGEITEFFLPRDFNDFCIGCNQCFTDEGKCPHSNNLSLIREALDGADLIILASPVYVFHASGSMKNLLDHFAYRWMPHRPEDKKKKINYDLEKLAQKIKKHHNKVVPSLKTKILFNVMRMAQTKGWNSADVKYWQDKAWLGSKRPWD